MYHKGGSEKCPLHIHFEEFVHNINKISSLVITLYELRWKNLVVQRPFIIGGVISQMKPVLQNAI